MSRVTKDSNPYVEARQEWNDRYLDLVRARRWWQLAAVADLALLGVLAGGLGALARSSASGLHESGDVWGRETVPGGTPVPSGAV